jgi:molybdenum cofactor cytidylyltransferase
VSREGGSRADDTVTAIVLAAGAGSRFSDVGHKLTAMLPPTASRPAEPVARRSIAAASEAAVGPVVVVTGRLTRSDLDLGPGLDDGVVETAHNADWASGQMTSVRVGLDIADRNGSAVAVIGLADQPGIEPSAWRAVADAAAVGTSPITVATYGGRRGNPVALHRSVWDLLPTGGDEGARSLMRLHPELVGEVPCSGSPTDIDTAEDLRRWQNS